MAYASTSEAIEDLALKIGDAVYLDVAKWHLYLKDAKLHVPLAEQLYPLVDDDRLSEDTVNRVLSEMKIAIGGGRRELPLLDLIPKAGQSDLMRILEDYQRDL